MSRECGLMIMIRTELEHTLDTQFTTTISGSWGNVDLSLSEKLIKYNKQYQLLNIDSILDLSG